jgi:AcrR family transcriptional regulator
VYRHFRDCEALIDAVATQDFEELAQTMRKAAAYVCFALKRPQHFAVMFDREQGPANIWRRPRRKL